MSFSPFSIRNMSHMIPCDYWLFLTDLLLTLLAIAFYVKLSLLLLLLSFVQVSRRFDSRKFRVRFSAQKCAGNTDDVGRLGEVRTTPIEVFSKRKIKKVSTPQDSNPRKRRRMNHAKASDLDALEAKYALIFDDIRATLEQQVCVSLSVCVCVCVCIHETVSRINLFFFYCLSLCSKKPLITWWPRYTLVRLPVVTTSWEMSGITQHLRSIWITQMHIHVIGENNSGIAGPSGIVRPPPLGIERYADTAVAFDFGPPTPIATPVLTSYNWIDPGFPERWSITISSIFDIFWCGLLQSSSYYMYFTGF